MMISIDLMLLGQKNRFELSKFSLNIFHYNPSFFTMEVNGRLAGSTNHFNLSYFFIIS